MVLPRTLDEILKSTQERSPLDRRIAHSEGYTLFQAISRTWTKCLLLKYQNDNNATKSDTTIRVDVPNAKTTFPNCC